MLKLKWEKAGNMYSRKKYIDDCDDMKPYVYYTGISCMMYLAWFMKKLIYEDGIKGENIYRCRKACLKLYENQNMILRTMRWFNTKIDSKNELLVEYSRKYAKCCEQIYTNVLLYDKYFITKDNKVLVRIIENAERTYYQEKDILDAYIEEAIATYTKFLVSNVKNTR